MKDEFVRLHYNPDLTTHDICSRLGISRGMITRWREWLDLGDRSYKKRGKFWLAFKRKVQWLRHSRGCTAERIAEICECDVDVVHKALNAASVIPGYR